MVPGLAPVPEHASQVTEVGMRTCAVLPDIGFLQRDFHVVAQVGAALASGAAAAAAAHAEQIVENIGEGGGEIGAKTVRRADAAVLERGVAEAVIGRPLVGVLEDLVGLVELLEAMLGVVVTRIAIRMPLHRLLAKGGFDVAVVCGALDRQRFVVAALGHSVPTLHTTLTAHVPRA